jgi:hypothetical protein
MFALVRDELLGELCRANDLFVPSFVYGLPPDIRASLALFCYRRSHIHSMGLAIAASCDEDNLVRAGGSVGAFIFTCSRKAAPREVLSPRADRRRITLATGVLREFSDHDEMAQEVSADPLPSVIWPSAWHSLLRLSRKEPESDWVSRRANFWTKCPEKVFLGMIPTRRKGRAARETFLRSAAFDSRKLCPDRFSFCRESAVPAAADGFTAHENPSYSRSRS